jgi:hypothetical protein
VAEVLGLGAQAGERVDDRAFADRRQAVDHRVGQEARARAQANPGAHDAIGPDLDAFAEVRALGDDGGGMDG